MINDLAFLNNVVMRVLRDREARVIRKDSNAITDLEAIKCVAGIDLAVFL